MHKIGIVHRDIKSHNILVDDRFDVKICDFGLARFKVSEFLIILGGPWEGGHAIRWNTGLHGSRAILETTLRRER